MSKRNGRRNLRQWLSRRLSRSLSAATSSGPVATSMVARDYDNVLLETGSMHSVDPDRTMTTNDLQELGISDHNPTHNQPPLSSDMEEGNGAMQYDELSDGPELDQSRILLPTDQELLIDNAPNNSTSIQPTLSATHTLSLLDKITDWEDITDLPDISEYYNLKLEKTSPQRPSTAQQNTATDHPVKSPTSSGELLRSNHVRPSTAPSVENSASISNSDQRSGRTSQIMAKYGLRLPELDNFYGQSYPVPSPFRRSSLSVASMSPMSPVQSRSQAIHSASIRSTSASRSTHNWNPNVTAALEQRLSHLTLQSNDLDIRLQTAESESRILNTEKHYYKSEHEKLQKILEQTAQENVALRIELDKVKKSSQLYIENSRSFEAENEKLHSDLANFSKENRDLTRQVQSLQSTIQNLESDRKSLFDLYQTEKTRAEDVKREFELLLLKARKMQDVMRELSDDNAKLRTSLVRGMGEAEQPKEMKTSNDMDNFEQAQLETSENPSRIVTGQSSDSLRVEDTAPSNIFDQTKELEKLLQQRLSAIDRLQGEYARMPLSSATNAIRKRKSDLEHQIDQLQQEISGLKLQLRSLHAL